MLGIYAMHKHKIRFEVKKDQGRTSDLAHYKIGGIIMDFVKYRKHPRVYKKKSTGTNEKTIYLNGKMAVGILTLAFLKGMFWGYIIKKKFD
jgi:hypothetical protein